MYYYPNYYQYGYFSYPVQPAINPEQWRVSQNNRQNIVQGEATWTMGGPVTQCGIPWSTNQYMTVAVGENSPYKCGEAIKVHNPENAREVIVTVVDEVRGFPPNRINLHQKAFEALGANLNQGVIRVEINPSPQLEEEKWGKYLLELVQTAYPNSNVTEYNTVSKEEISSTQTKETYEYILRLQNEEIKVRGTVIYNPQNDRIISFNFTEV